jgi:hypothetical protein
VCLPVDLAREIDRLLHCAELTPLIGADAARARLALRALQPAIFEPVSDEPDP